MDHRIKKARWFIEMNYAEKISVDALASSVHLSRSRFDALFKLEMKLSPVRYIKLVRIRKAADLLRVNSILSIKEVMTRVGIKDKSHFGRDFKEVFGLNPSDYRRRYLTRPSQQDEGRFRPEMKNQQNLSRVIGILAYS